MLRLPSCFDHVWPLLGACSLAMIVAGSPLIAATDLASISASPDATGIYGALEVQDHQVFVSDLGGVLLPVDLGPIPESAAVDAFHDPMDGRVLFSLEGKTDLGGLTVSSSDVVVWEGGFHEIYFDSTVSGVPSGVNVDAITLDDQDLLLSFDLPVDLGGEVFMPQDLVRWNGGTYELAFDGSAAGVSSSLDLNAAHLLDNGNLLVSFDTHGQVDNVFFADEDLLEYNLVTATWELAYDGSAQHPAWWAADLDALTVGQAPSIIEVPTLSTLSLVVLSLFLTVLSFTTIRRQRMVLSRSAEPRKD